MNIKDKSMPSRVRDAVYGDVVIDEPLIFELLQSRPVQRLKRVSQAGASSLVRKGRDVTRFEHSVGVYFLTTLLGGDLASRAFALLHDVSHTAFSHTVDFVFRDRNEEYHERLLPEVISASEIPKILSSYGLEWDMLQASTDFTIVDTSAPDVCADRIDYTLRDLVHFGEISQSDATELISALTVVNGKICIRGLSTSRQFVIWYAKLVDELFMNSFELSAHRKMAGIFRKALDKGLIEPNAFLMDDKALIETISRDEEIDSALHDLKNSSGSHSGESRRTEMVKSKVRTIDPLTMVGSRVARLSEFSPEIEAIWEPIRKKGKEGVQVALGNAG